MTEPIIDDDEEPASSASGLAEFLKPLIEDKDVHVYICDSGEATIGFYETVKMYGAVVCRNVNTHEIDKDGKVNNLIPVVCIPKKFQYLDSYLQDFKPRKEDTVADPIYEPGADPFEIRPKPEEVPEEVSLEVRVA